MFSSDTDSADSGLTLRTIGLGGILRSSVTHVYTRLHTHMYVCSYSDAQWQPPPDTLSIAPVYWEEALGRGEGFQLRLLSSRPKGRGSSGWAAFDQDSGHDLKAEGPKGLYTVMIKFQSFLVFSSAGNTWETLFWVRSGQL